MDKTIHGRIHGKRIELDEASDIADGREVDVILKPATDQRKRPWGEGIRRSAGIAAEHEAEFDEVFAQVEHDRKSAKYREHCE